MKPIFRSPCRLKSQRSAFIKAATEAVEELGPNAYRPGAIPEPSVAILAVRPEHSFRVRPEHSFRLQ